MPQISVGIREFKARLGQYVQQVKSGSTIIITERGKPVVRLIPIRPSLQARARELQEAGFIAWSGRKLTPKKPSAETKGRVTVADLLLEDRE